MIYLDSSAILRLIRPALWSAELERFLDQIDPTEQATTSAVGFVEVRRALVRDEANELTVRAAEALLSDFARIDVTAAVIEQAGRLPEKHLRALDAIHVASAIQIAPVLAALVTYDRRMFDAAQFAGLPVVAPGMLR